MSEAPDDPIFQQTKDTVEEVDKVQKALSLRRGSNLATRLFLERVEELQMKGLNCDPIQVLMELACGKVLNTNGTVVPMVPMPDPAVRGKAAAELCSYIFPKRKAVELSSDPEQPVKFVVMPDHEPLPGADGALVLDAKSQQKLLDGVAEMVDEVSED